MQNNYYNPFGNENDDDHFLTNRLLAEIEARDNQKKDLLSVGFSLGFGIILCLVIQSFLGTVLELLNVNSLYKTNFIFFTSFNSFFISVISIALPFAIIALSNRHRYTEPLVPSKKLGFVKGFLWVSFGLMACVLFNFVIVYMIAISEALGYELTTPKTPELDSALGCVMLVISTAIMPAICEEFSMRCCALGLLKKHGKGFAIFAVSIIFGLLHGNLIQFVFAFLVGCILSFVTIKTDNILPAILIHALSNGRSVMNEIIEFSISSELATKVTAITTIIILSFGIASTIYLAMSNQFKLENEKSDGDVLPFGKKLLYLLPGLALPILLLVSITISSIVKI